MTKRWASRDSPAATGRRELPSVTRLLSQGFDRSNQVDVTALAPEPEPGNDDRALQEFTAIRQRGACLCFPREYRGPSDQSSSSIPVFWRWNALAFAAQAVSPRWFFRWR
jgi:hypothetical protein